MEKAIAAGVFLTTYGFIASERFPRWVVSVAGGLALITSGLLSLEEAMAYVNWETVGLLFGMFLLIAMLAEGGFFTWLALTIAEKVHYRLSLIYLLFPLLAGFLAAFMDSITVLLFFSTLSYHLARSFRVSPVPLVVAEVVAANIGGAGTLVGDPPNVILGTTLGFTFTDFARHTGPAAALSLLTAVGFLYLTQRKALRRIPQMSEEDLQKQGLRREIKDPELMAMGLYGLSVAVFFLITHNWLSELTGLRITSAAAALFPALVVFTVAGRKAHHLLGKIDLESLLFFVGLFVVVGGLERAGLIDLFARGLVKLAGPSPLALVLLLLWAGALLSSVVDNVPLALTMAYVLRDISHLPGAPALSIMVWALALGADMGGNMTPIGASANVVAYSTLERFGVKIGWLRWLALAGPATVLALILSSVLIGLKLHFGLY